MKNRFLRKSRGLLPRQGFRGLSTDGRPAMPTPWHNHPGQAKPGLFAEAAQTVKAHRASLTNRCRHANIASCSCAAACWCRHRKPKPQSNHTAGARAQASNELQPLSRRHSLTPSRGSIQRGWRGGEVEEERAHPRQGREPDWCSLPSREPLVRSIPSSP